MPNIKDMLPPSDFLKADDLKIDGEDYRDVDLTISEIDLREYGRGDNKDSKWTLHFRGTKKILPLNMVNLKKLAELFGEESDGWIGQKIQLFVVDVQGPRGDLVPGIRLRRPRNTQVATSLGNVNTAPRPTPVQPTEQPVPHGEFDPDEIPF